MIKKLKTKKATVQIPAEYLKALLDDADALRWILRLMNACWTAKRTPESWHISTVVPIFKKGNPEDCGNYRPISLVSILYKVYAMLLLNRLKAAGVERRLWPSQFGFRQGFSTEDALFIVRRNIDKAWAARGGSVLLLALDWKKAFDCLAPDRMLIALRRFGINEDMLTAIEGIYKNRFFNVRDGGHHSKLHPQRAGISQGCPLSPLLFGIVMTIVMEDARKRLGASARHACSKGDLSDALFADDTLLISVSAKHLEEYMAAITYCGAQYGLQVHWGKVHLLNVQSKETVRTALGDILALVASTVYLGSCISANGRFACEIARKIGSASAAFNGLQAAWRHTAIHRLRKIEIFNACILSKVMYGTASAWLTTKDFRRLDGFQARCLRKILRIPTSFVSRVSNRTVLQRAGTIAISKTVRSKQLRLLNQVLSNPKKTMLRDCTFVRGTRITHNSKYIRRVGRPRQNWADDLLRLD